jgi:hypothetical protein
MAYVLTLVVMAIFSTGRTTDWWTFISITKGISPQPRLKHHPRDKYALEK